MSKPSPDPDALFEQVYTQLQGMAASIRRLDVSVAVQPTSLVHEAWLRMAGKVSIQSEEHFKSIAARAMRQSLRDRARRQHSQKRGGGWHHVTLTDIGTSESVVDALALTTALDELEALNPRHAAVVELRVLGGLTTEEIARALDIHERSVRRDWRFARAWLMARLSVPA